MPLSPARTNPSLTVVPGSPSSALAVFFPIKKVHQKFVLHTQQTKFQKQKKITQDHWHSPRSVVLAIVWLQGGNTHACLSPRIYIYIYICMYVCMYVCMYICMYIWYVYTYVCMYVCMYVYIYVYIYMYIYTHIQRLTAFICCRSRVYNLCLFNVCKKLGLFHGQNRTYH